MAKNATIMRKQRKFKRWALFRSERRNMLFAGHASLKNARETASGGGQGFFTRIWFQ
jgi:hypothetical protein